MVASRPFKAAFCTWARCFATMRPNSSPPSAGSATSPPSSANEIIARASTGGGPARSSDDQAQVFADREVLVGDGPLQQVLHLVLRLGHADRDLLALHQASGALQVVAHQEAGPRRR